MNLVKQKDPNGCGIACVAMLSNQTYEYVRGVWLDKCNGKEERIVTPTLGGGGLRATEIMDLLHLFGVRIGPCVTPCIVLIGNHNWQHYVVVTEDGTIFNPA